MPAVTAVDLPSLRRATHGPDNSHAGPLPNLRRPASSKHKRRRARTTTTTAGRRNHQLIPAGGQYQAIGNQPNHHT